MNLPHHCHAQHTRLILFHSLIRVLESPSDFLWPQYQRSEDFQILRRQKQTHQKIDPTKEMESDDMVPVKH